MVLGATGCASRFQNADPRANSAIRARVTPCYGGVAGVHICRVYRRRLLVAPANGAGDKATAQTMREDGGGCLPLTITGAAQPLPLDVTSNLRQHRSISDRWLAWRTRKQLCAKSTSHATTQKTAQRYSCKNFKPMIGAENIVTLDGHARSRAHDIAVPGDPSSAAFPLVAALIVPGSKLRLENVLNPQRDGLIRVLTRMGATLNAAMNAPKRASRLPIWTFLMARSRALLTRKWRSPIDEYPALAVAAAFAEGTTHMAGIGELGQGKRPVGCGRSGLAGKWRACRSRH